MRLRIAPQAALIMIQRILENDTDYQAPELKLGAVWNICDLVATYERGEGCVTVKVRED